MDLFDDLPPPTNTSKTEKADQTNTSTASDLFCDLPPPDKTTTCKIGEKRKLEQEEQYVGKKQMTEASVQFKLRGFVAERKGERDEMQDAHVILDDFVEAQTGHEDICRMAYYGVFDGHAGAQASQFAAQHLHNNITPKMPKGLIAGKDKEIKKCLVDAYRLTDDQFLQEASKQTPVLKDGSTAVCVLCINDTLYVANLGDSKALVCRCDSSGKVSIVPLSKDHSPTEYTERIRIQKAGGYVKDGRVLGVLEVSRSIGDGRFKRSGVISTPDIMRCRLTDNDRFVLLACDGLWKAFTVDAAIKYVSKILDDESITGQSEADQDQGDSPGSNPVAARFQTACNRIASDAVRNGSSDNVTVMLVSVTRR